MRERAKAAATIDFKTSQYGTLSTVWKEPVFLISTSKPSTVDTWGVYVHAPLVLVRSEELNEPMNDSANDSAMATMECVTECHVTFRVSWWVVERVYTRLIESPTQTTTQV